MRGRGLTVGDSLILLSSLPVPSSLYLLSYQGIQINKQLALN